MDLIVSVPEFFHASKLKIEGKTVQSFQLPYNSLTWHNRHLTVVQKLNSL